jgi:hypothetical protein
VFVIGLGRGGFGGLELGGFGGGEQVGLVHGGSLPQFCFWRNGLPCVLLFLAASQGLNAKLFSDSKVAKAATPKAQQSNLPLPVARATPNPAH